MTDRDHGPATGRPLGVGFVGCGAVTQASHIPALASLPNLFQVTHCSDLHAGVAMAVASRLPAARSSSSIDDLLHDDAVDVVAVCVPDKFHADVVVAACDAGKKAVLCEKPLASSVEEVDRIVEASERTGVPVMVATMHRFDPVVHWLVTRWGDLPARASLIRSTMYVPPNGALVDLATEFTEHPAAVPSTDPASQPDRWRAILPGAWASTTFVHHMPLLRMAFNGMPDEIVARALGIVGAQVSLRWGQRLAQLSGIAYNFGCIDWSFELWAPDMHVRIEFPYSFLAGHSATAHIWRPDDDGVGHFSFSDTHETGYRNEWRHLWRVIAGEESPLTPARASRADVELVRAIADAGRSLMTASGDSDPK